MKTKYIDAEKLIAEIDSMLSACTKQTHTGVFNTCTHIKGLISILQQEQQEVDLEKGIDFEDEWKAYYDSHLFNRFPMPSKREIARHFYELGINAKK